MHVHMCSQVVDSRLLFSTASSEKDRVNSASQCGPFASVPVARPFGRFPPYCFDIYNAQYAITNNTCASFWAGAYFAQRDALEVRSFGVRCKICFPVSVSGAQALDEWWCIV